MAEKIDISKASPLKIFNAIMFAVVKHMGIDPEFGPGIAAIRRILSEREEGKPRGNDPLDAENFWHGYKFECDDGDIEYHVHGPKDAFIVFEGPTAKENYDRWMDLVDGDRQ